MKRGQHKNGFTIVELLIVIVVIGILAAITVVAYTGMQQRSKNTSTHAQLMSVNRLIQAYNADQGSYPNTGGLTNVRTDTGCSGGSKQSDWVPSLTTRLPQSNNAKAGNGFSGCYMYASDGSKYVLSAWNSVGGDPQKTTAYRRLGFRGPSYYETNYYLCNNPSVGGMGSGSYVSTSDQYKYSYTVSNITDCDETPPAGA
jgi:prepilin-type N-terminal cleavage/methylation domain-containing protein